MAKLASRCTSGDGQHWLSWQLALGGNDLLHDPRQAKLLFWYTRAHES